MRGRLHGEDTHLRGILLKSLWIKARKYLTWTLEVLAIRTWGERAFRIEGLGELRHRGRQQRKPRWQESSWAARSCAVVRGWTGWRQRTRGTFPPSALVALFYHLKDFIHLLTSSCFFYYDPGTVAGTETLMIKRQCPCSLGAYPWRAPNPKLVGFGK